MKGVLDRFEGNDAVILVEENKEEFIVAKQKLPASSFEGTWFHLIHLNGKYSINSIDVATTEEKTTANALLLEQLRKRGKESKFKRNSTHS